MTQGHLQFPKEVLTGRRNSGSNLGLVRPGVAGFSSGFSGGAGF